MAEKRKVIFITDGDEYARRAVEITAKEIGGRCISMSQGNPSVLSGAEIVSLIKQSPYDPVLVMFDDSGYMGEGSGEMAMRYVANDRDIEVLGVIAVASKSRHEEWTKVDVSIDRDGELTPYGVDKYGAVEYELGRITGDTVYCVNELHAPIVVGIGDIGKMARKDDYKKGAPITKLAVEIILERSGNHDIRKQGRNETDS
ncbi:stage V sporulation protein AE [Peribacillus cavernae]|uniref:Stage V sporulation protein AE n=1 Tax=Peribacillus cavernae TaxID=1674310 RepID=A0A3S0V8A8_9BACI|nr:stage V sporulation protein AE [Peribacillus cavernae]MDQ0219051.1 stage V sporulation protein AE [Peribacillus cavernae]RUQ26505.1 stage V sporulation protein AE [Peribacillus cavernae]